jgi:taurine dioxygenase
VVRLTVRPLSAALGVSVEDVDVRAPLTPETAEALRQLLAAHQLLLFRDVELSVAEHRRFIEVFAPVADEQDNGDYHSFVTEGEELIYHCDYGFMPEPLPVVSLWAVEIPPGAATTSFASGVHACQRLPADLPRRLEGKGVLHASDVRSATQRSTGPLRVEDLERVSYRGTSIRPSSRTFAAAARCSSWTSS